MNAFFKLVTLLLLVLVMFSCAGDKTKVLRIGTNAEYPPFEYREGEEYKGIDMDLAKAIAEKLGMKLEILDMEFDSLIPSLDAKKIDMAMAAITITEERQQVISFSNPYYSVDQAIICKNDSTVVITVENEDQLVNYRIGVQNGTTGQIYIDNNLIATGKMNADNFRKYPTNIEAITDMLNGNIDLVIIDSSAAKGYEALKPIKTVYTIATGEQYGIGMPKDSPLKEQVDKALEEILTSEQWNTILQTYIVK